MLDIGKKLSGRYLIKGNVGMGGMANVFLADDLILDREVAIKVLRYDFQNDQDAIRRFQREALAATELVHPNIVSVYDVGEEDGMQYLVMEYVKGMDLKRYIQIHYPMDYSVIINIMQQILSAVALAHEHRIIHRDLKPQNILLNEEGVVKITDFGIAIALSETSITQTNSMLGSVHYLSPEQARGGMATSQSDIYAIGIILYEMLTGSVPFDGESAVTIALKHFQDEIPALRSRDENIPQPLENAVLKATAKEPTDRYKSAEEMSKDLETVLSPERRNEAPWHPQAMTNETKALTPITDTVSSKKEEDAAEAKEEKKPKKPKKKWLLFLAILVVLLAMIGLGTYLSSAGSRGEVAIPEVAGLTESAAREKLRESGLQAADQTREYPSDDQDEGRIVKTNPEEGAEVRRTHEVILYISSGSPEVEMDDYTEQTYDDALDKLKELEFKESNISSEEEFDDSVPAGQIISQSPDAGEEVVPEETEVSFVVSQGPAPVSMVNFVGSTEDAAKNSLRGMGLGDNSVEVQQSYSDQTSGTIIGQTPSEGEEVIPGETTIVFSVSAGTEQVDVPDVEGDSEAEAEKSLKDAGFEVEKEEEFDDSVEEGDVISTDPSAGSTEDKGSTVSMVVSKGEEEEEEPETKSFTVDVEASFKGDGDDEDNEDEDDSASQTITVWLTDMDHDDEQYEQIVLDSEDDSETIEVPITVEEGEEATITVQRDDEDKVSQDIDKADTVQVP
ncbi:Stk1 family PASTA domain-containing Ser/Thr kinase [Tetragenococcus koreensis]|uniref:Stk1 family PASTA domain-containing Ser/Thr kinase n=1 Tax=Tetragenococcus koreensis TaxID=290335 RepID=UPI000F4F4CBF|nr:Stk1 family PASTA domain-containing Ser/Thr kinase [Tetragenococcus koreensis]AYW46266.1 Stk1 family PASTA domain-containing Ser/Thr kinase [Tetragenococcus koreensis]MCF1585030.1 Stk1 family PASTA domain-containing Ser/Thr kinase [Tetragenococcus koreensis]MCF1614593.1 Stk1 family PASTA domain-containing Ser/Thr kinase [Tetragenococcus koreensis]MCF1619417.1 Stk1 family PASTA domain-containing Ser/Thr kinase [Tetragenococcus koreensis]MCF1624376.1 Stk1 family PASTA domain-containing Ser/Th